MTFALIILSALAMTVTLRQWQEVEMRAARWRIYALRDELRAEMHEGRVVKEAFIAVDERLSGVCSICQAEMLSLWHMIPAMMLARKTDAQEELKRVLGKNGAEPAKHVYDLAMYQAVRLLVWRHAFLFFLLLPTIIGAIFMAVLISRMAKVLLTPVAKTTADNSRYAFNI